VSLILSAVFLKKTLKHAKERMKDLIA